MIRMYVCIQTCLIYASHMHMYVYIRKYTSTYVYTCIHTHVCMYASCMHVCMYVYTHAHTYICTQYRIGVQHLEDGENGERQAHTHTNVGTHTQTYTYYTHKLVPDLGYRWATAGHVPGINALNALDMLDTLDMLNAIIQAKFLPMRGGQALASGKHLPRAYSGQSTR